MVKKTGPMIGMSDRTGIVRRGSSATWPALDRPSPSTRARPVPRKVRASPDTTWSARRWMVMTPWTRLSRPPASIAARTPSHGLPVLIAIEKPATAPMSIIPSTPRLRTPLRSAKISPIAANSEDRPARDAGRQDGDRVHQAVASRRSKRTR